jgi:hypothetical protein
LPAPRSGALLAKMYRKVRGACTLAVMTVALTRVAVAEDDAATRSSARKVAMDGIAALQQGNADVAAQKLEKAFQILRVPSVALWSARALAKRGQLVEASERYLEASRLSNFKGGEQAVQEQAQKDAAKELEELTPRIPSVLIAVEGASAAGVSVMLDGKAVPMALLGEERPVNPGTHQVTAQRGKQQAQESVTVAETEKKRVVLRFSADGATAAIATAEAGSAPPAPSQPSLGAVDSQPSGSTRTNKTLAYVALAAGGAGIALGSVTGLMALGKRSDLDKNPNCRDDRCLPVAQGEVDSFRTFRTVSSVGFIAGGVFAATGVVLLLTSSPSQKGELAAHQLALRVAPGDVSITGRF